MIRSCMLLAVLVLAAVASADEVRMLPNKSITGDVDKITAKELTLKTSGGPVSVPMSQVLELTLRQGRTVPAAPSYIEVQLLDDSLLRCTKIAFGVKETTLNLTSGVSIKVPNSALVTVLRDAHDEMNRAQWVKLLKGKTNRDRIFLARDGNLNPIEGNLGDIDEAKQTIKFKSEVVGSIEPQLDKLTGLQFARIQVSTEQAMCKVIDIDGNQLVASRLTLDAAAFAVTTPFGAKLSLDAKSIAKIDFNFGKLTFLSDLDAKEVESPFLGGFRSFRKDANLDGNPIILQDKRYEKGLSMYAGAELQYSLAGKYKEFKAVLGVDSRIAEEGQGKVTVVVYCDNRKIFTQEVSTKAAVPLALNVKDVETLKIVVSGENLTNYSGHATLANAHVSQ